MNPPPELHAYVHTVSVVVVHDVDVRVPFAGAAAHVEHVTHAPSDDLMYLPGSQVHIILYPEPKEVNPELHAYTHVASVVAVHAVVVRVAFVGATGHVEHVTHPEPS